MWGKKIIIRGDWWGRVRPVEKLSWEGVERCWSRRA